MRAGDSERAARSGHRGLIPAADTGWAGPRARPAQRPCQRAQALACMASRGLACSAALGSFSFCLTRTVLSMTSPRFLSTLCQYSKARNRIGYRSAGISWNRSHSCLRLIPLRECRQLSNLRGGRIRAPFLGAVPGWARSPCRCPQAMTIRLGPGRDSFLGRSLRQGRQGLVEGWSNPRGSRSTRFCGSFHGSCVRTPPVALAESPPCRSAQTAAAGSAVAGGPMR